MSLFSRLRLKLTAEDGFAVPTVTLMIVAALAVAGVAVTTSIQGQAGSVRDQDTKSALAAAESGVEQALLHFNRYGLASESTPCAPLGSGATEEGWCPAVSGTTLNGGSVTYWARPEGESRPNGEFAFTELEVVSLGTVDGVSRRVDVTATSSSGNDMFVDATVKSEEGITLDSNSQIHAGTATNGDLTIAANAKQCGTATVGIGKEKKGSGEYSTDIECGVLSGDPGEDEISLPPVEQGAAPTINDNGRLFSLDKISGNKKKACFDGHDGNEDEDDSCGPRELEVGTNTSVTLGGTTYSFCKLTLSSNSSLYVADKSEVTIYFDSPEACGYEDGVTQLELQSNTRITSEPGKSASVALLFVGSKELSTNILMNSNTAVDGPCEQNFVLYAPYSDITLNSNTKFCGALAGKTVHLDSNAQVWTSSGIQSWFLPLTAPHFVAERFVDCVSSAPAGLPDEGC
jgi:hypothetical protein